MCLTQPVNMLKTHKSVKENSFKEVQTDLEGLLFDRIQNSRDDSEIL